MGPALLFWGVLLVVLAPGLGLGRSGLAHLKAYEWVLLSLGVATQSLAVLVLMAAWFAALRWRGYQSGWAGTRYKALQLGLILLSLATLGMLLGTIPQGFTFRAEHAHLPRTLRQFELVQRFHHRPIAPSLGGVRAYVGVPGEYAGLVALDCVCLDQLVEVGVAAIGSWWFLAGGWAQKNRCSRSLNRWIMKGASLKRCSFQ